MQPTVFEALKEIEKIGKMISVIEEYEYNELFPLVIKQITRDLDDRVKANAPNAAQP